MPRPAERWIVLAIGLVLAVLAAHGCYRLAEAVRAQQPMHQPSADPAEGTHPPTEANDHGDVRGGVPD